MSLNPVGWIYEETHICKVGSNWRWHFFFLSSAILAWFLLIQLRGLQLTIKNCSLFCPARPKGWSTETPSIFGTRCRQKMRNWAKLQKGESLQKMDNATGNKIDNAPIAMADIIKSQPCISRTSTDNMTTVLFSSPHPIYRYQIHIIHKQQASFQN